jgi:hypothetical protein
LLAEMSWDAFLGFEKNRLGFTYREQTKDGRERRLPVLVCRNRS